MNDLELEVKILNVNVEEMKNKLISLGAEYQNEVTQKIYTYDCYEPIIIYKSMLNDYKITKSKNSLMKIVTFLNQLKPIFIESDKLLFKEKTNFEYLEDYILNNINNIDYKILNDTKVKNVIKNTKNRFFKWIRLRQNGDKIELTIKYIYNVNKEYNIDEVKEVEINVSSFEIANKIIEEMGYFRKKLVEKREQVIY